MKKKREKEKKRRSQQNVRHFIVEFFLRKGEGKGEEGSTVLGLNPVHWYI